MTKLGVCDPAEPHASFVRYRARLDEKFFRPILKALPCPLQIDYLVDDDIGDVHSLWTWLAGHRFGQDPLRRLGRRKAGDTRQSSICDPRVRTVLTFAPMAIAKD